MARFTLPRDLYHGKGSLETLKTLEGKKAMICLEMCIRDRLGPERGF